MHPKILFCRLRKIGADTGLGISVAFCQQCFRAAFFCSRACFSVFGLSAPDVSAPFYSFRFLCFFQKAARFSHFLITFEGIFRKVYR